MNPKKLTLCGFKSFISEQVFTFPSEPGLYSLSGNNNAEPDLGSNGAGKSTIWDGLCWVLYGKTVRGVRAGDLSTWGSAKGFYGRFEWSNGVNNYNLYRSWKPNSLVLSVNNACELDVSQEDINTATALPYESFLFSILMGQSRPMFLDLRASEQAQIFSEVFRLNRWLDYSDRASNAAKELAAHSMKADNAIARLGAALDRMQKEKSSISGQELLWSSEHANTRQELLDSVKANNNREHKLLSDMLILGIDEGLISAEIEELEKRASTVNRRVENNLKNLRAIDKQIGEHRADLSAEEESASYFYKHCKVGGSSCTSCGQSVSTKYAISMGKKSDRSITKIKGKLHILHIAKEREEKLLSESENAHHELLNRIKDITDIDAAYVLADRRHTEGRLKVLANSRGHYKRELLILDKKINPFKKLSDDLYFDLRDTVQHLGTAKRAFDFINEKRKQTEYWIKGFKDIRLIVMSEFLTQLEVEVNNALYKLGLIGWKIYFSTEKETRSKTIKKGFHTLIKSPNNDSLVPWEAWSGGESQRIRLAGNMGLSNLILAHRGVMANIEIWDEPSTHMGKEGVSDLLELLHDRAILSNKQIWVVEHNVLDFGNFAGNALIVKGNNGSTIQQ